jgi:hypothetical protein
MKKTGFIYLIVIFLTIILLCSMTVSFTREKEPFDFMVADSAPLAASKYTAVIVEPRQHPALDFVLQNFLENLDDQWNIIVFHGNLNKEFVEKIANEKREKFGSRIQLIQIDIDNLGSLWEYSSLLLDPDFYNYIPTEIFLVFQTDTLICEKYKNQIYDFLDYDYVGAPVTGFDPWGTEGGVGNGGLSLRRKSKMLEIIEKCKIRDDKSGYREDLHYEDLFFAFPCDGVTEFHKPTLEEAKRFGVEKIYHDKTFGVHKAYVYNDVSLFADSCPQVEKLSQLQK